MDLAHERRGAGTPLVLVHGLAHRWQAWEPVLDELAVHHDVIAVDLPGFGKSPVPAHGMPTSVPDLAATLAKFLAKLGVERPHLAGNSLGGAVAIELGAADAARSVTAFSPLGLGTRAEGWWGIGVLVEHRALTYLPAGATRRILATPAGRRLAMGMIMMRPDLLSAPRCVDDALAMRRGKGFWPVVRFSRGYRLPVVAADLPVTIAWGEHDRILLLRQAARARQLLPHARHVPRAGCGHVPMGDDPQLVARTILETTGAVAAD
ncbi:MAG TPA: alpha/beta fold hydrolase [Micromonosporaceae bacterium]